MNTTADVLSGQGFALLSCAQETLALAQKDIHSLETVADVEMDAATDDACCGYIRKGQSLWPVYTFGTRQLLDGIPEDQRFVVLLKNAAGSYGLLCSDFKLLDPSQVRLYAVPACMDSRNALLSALLLYDGTVYSVGNSAALLRLIREQTP